MPYGHLNRHPLLAFLADVDALQWAFERAWRLRSEEVRLEDLEGECAEAFSRMASRPTVEPLEAARRMLELRDLQEEEFRAIQRYTYALLTDSEDDHGPS